MFNQKSKTAKIALIGCGAVGMSYIFSCINQEIASEYLLIDPMIEPTTGNVMDIEDAISWGLESNQTIKLGSYEELKDVDLLVITASRAQKPDETRLQMVADNAKIMSDIANKVKTSGFKGITLIAANPVDVQTYVYWKITGFAKNRVVGSGTSLDSARLQMLIAKQVNVSAKEVDAYVLGEHGDSSVSIFSNAKVGKKKLSDFNLAPEVLNDIHYRTYKRAYEIIKLKRATFYGIGMVMARLSKAILNDKKMHVPLSYISDQSGPYPGCAIGLMCELDGSGITKTVSYEMNADEKAKLDNSAKILTDVTTDILKKLI